MKRLTVRSCVINATSALCLVAALRLPAQTTAPASAAAPKEDSETLVLSPFVVEATEDSGYTAKDTLAGTRVRTNLKDQASAISVVTTAFLRDTNANNNEDLLRYTVSTEVGGLKGNFTSQSGSSQYIEPFVNPNSSTRVRGLEAADNTRDYFLTEIPWDSFNVGRVDLQRGPNSILFGVGSPGGIINSNINEASMKTSYKFENQVSSFSTLRNSIDLNQNVIKNVLSIRVAGVLENKKFRQKEAYNRASRTYAALRFTPQLFGEGNHTDFRAKYEHGSVNSNNPRALPPVDMITPWFRDYNKRTLNQYTAGSDQNGSEFDKGGWAQGRTYWETPKLYADATSNRYIAGLTNFNPNNINGLPAYRPAAVPPYGQYAANTSSVVGGPYYSDVVITDSSIFDFYNHMLDGRGNKREWQSWNALNLAISQSFMDDRIALDVTLDHQDYTGGQLGFMQGANYGIGVDINTTIQDGSVNANLGRPIVSSSGFSGNSERNIVRDSARFTIKGELRAEDILGKTDLAKMLGHHVITALMQNDNKLTVIKDWSQYAAHGDWASLIGKDPASTKTNERLFDWSYYAGTSLLGATSAAGANVQPIGKVIAPAATSQVRYFNRTWNVTGVLISDPYVPAVDFGRGPYTQRDNPANYVGWTDATVKWLNYNNPADRDELLNQAVRTKYNNKSKGLTLQSYVLDNDLVITYGWRSDRVTNNPVTAARDANGLLQYPAYGDPVVGNLTASGQSKSWGGVYHLPKALMSKVPGGTTFSLLYNKSNNFKADVPRSNIEGKVIANPNGDTKEYGFVVTTLDDKLSLKINWYKTIVKNATFNVTNGNSIAGLGGNGYKMWALPSWGYAWAAQLQAGEAGTIPPANTYHNYAVAPNVDGSAYAGTTVRNGGVPVTNATEQKAFNQKIISAWLNDLPTGKGFFDAYGMTFPINPGTAKSSGQLMNGLNAAQQGYIIGASGAYNPGNQQPGTITAVSTSDQISKGVEYELNYSPTKNWNLTVNYSHVNASNLNIDPATQAFMKNMKAFMAGPGGALRMWGNDGGSSGNDIGTQWYNDIYLPYVVLLNSIGRSSPAIAPWRLNLVTTYKFENDALKGVYVGGGMRLEAGKIIGYKYSATYKNVEGTVGGLDPDTAMIGSSQHHYDLWFGYSRKLTNKINWSVQLTLNDVGASKKIVAERLQPNGNLALGRIQEGMSWNLRNTFEF